MPQEGRAIAAHPAASLGPLPGSQLWGGSEGVALGDIWTGGQNWAWVPAGHFISVEARWRGQGAQGGLRPSGGMPVVTSLGSWGTLPRPHSPAHACLNSSPCLGLRGLPRVGELGVSWLLRSQPPLRPLPRYLSMHCGAMAVRTCWGPCSWLANTSFLRYPAWLHEWPGWRVGW